jgi:hypothetical protein
MRNTQRGLTAASLKPSEDGFMSLIILFGAMLALAWLSTRSRAPGAATVPLHSGRTRQRRR